ncbi:MAG: ABC transporter ATP-binding protein [Planctomycetaceae bacterium]|nr:ABC transporter ATP-binding protein [Planctomycetaceae bacterium]
MIEFVDVRRQYGTKTAVAGLNLTVASGELFAFLGPNGAGKTTTIKMLVGLLRPTSGTIRVCGFDVAAESRDARRLLSYVPDEPYLYDKLSGREFLRFIVEMYGLDPRVGAERIEREIAAFELADFVDDLTESYSHGMKQRLVFASAMLHDPAVLVIDEPMVGLDPRSARILKDLLRAKSRAGTTIFLSTHTLGLAEEIADRIGILDHGQLMFLGTVTELEQELQLHETNLERLFLELTSSPATNGSPPAPESKPRTTA